MSEIVTEQRLSARIRAATTELNCSYANDVVFLSGEICAMIKSLTSDSHWGRGHDTQSLTGRG